MENISKIHPQILKNSPIEFVLVAPVRGHDKIIISSENAGLDIKGLAVDRDTDTVSLKNLNSGLSLMFGIGRQLNVLESYSTADFDSEYDGRMSSFRFAWVGYCAPYRKEKIERVLNRSLREVRMAVQGEDEYDLELVFSPVILNCSIAHQVRLRSRRVLLAVTAIYTLVGLSVAIFGGFFRLLIP